MNLTWNLSDLFQSTKDFYNEIENTKKMVAHIKRYEKKNLDEHSLFDMLEESYKIKEKINNILIYGSLVYYKNIKSKECAKLKEDAENFNNEINSNLQFVERKIINLGKETVDHFISRNQELKIYQFYFDNLFRKQEHVQDEETNIHIKENIDSINEQLNLYNATTRDMKYGSIEVNGKTVEITSSNTAKYLSARDQETRKQTYFAINEAYKEQEKTFANILDTIYGKRNENAALERYDSVLEKSLFEENIDPKIIESLIKAVHHNLGLFQRYLKIKAKLLGIDEPHLYDFGVPLDSNIKRKYSLEDAIEIVKNALKPLGPEYLETVDLLLNGHIDALPNEDKHQSIVFSWSVYSFLNFRGSYVDIKNIIHELGHIVNYYLSKENLPFIYQDSTVFVGETASIVNEILLSRYLYQNATSKEEKIFYLSKEIENYFTSVLKQTMYTEFELDLYDTKQSTCLTPELLSEKYKTLMQSYYGNDIIYDEISHIEWTRLGHLYRWSYYPYRYATGLIIASVIVNSLLDEHTLSQEEYVAFLSSGSSLYALDLLKSLHIDLTNSNVIENGFKVLEKDIEELEQLLDSQN